MKTALSCYSAIDVRHIPWQKKASVQRKMELITRHGAHIVKARVRVTISRGKVLLPVMSYCAYATDFTPKENSKGMEIRSPNAAVSEIPFFAAPEYAYHAWHPTETRLSFDCTVYNFSAELLRFLLQHELHFKEQIVLKYEARQLDAVPERSVFVPIDVRDYNEQMTSEGETANFGAMIVLLNHFLPEEKKVDENEQ